MAYSAWKILFSLLSDLVQKQTPKTEYEKEWCLLQDMMVLSKPYLLTEGFTVLLLKKDNSSSQNVSLSFFFNSSIDE